MQADRFTIKSQEALAAAGRLAEGRRNPQVVPLHLLAALLAEGSDAAAAGRADTPGGVVLVNTVGKRKADKEKSAEQSPLLCFGSGDLKSQPGGRRQQAQSGEMYRTRGDRDHITRGSSKLG